MNRDPFTKRRISQNVSTSDHTRSVLKIRLNGYPFVVIGTSTLVQDPSLLKVTNEGTFEGTSKLKVTKVRRYLRTKVRRYFSISDDEWCKVV